MTAASTSGTISLLDLQRLLSRQEAIEGPTTSLGISDKGDKTNHASFLENQPLPNAIELVAIPGDDLLVVALNSRGAKWNLEMVTTLWIAGAITRVAMFRAR